MRKTMKKLTQGATRLLVLALGLGLVSTGWAATPVAVWDGAADSEYDFSNLTHNGYVLGNLGEGYANSVAADYSYLQVGNQDKKAAIVLKKSDSTAMGASTVIIKCENMMAKTGANRAVLSFLNGNNPYIGVAQENTTGDHTSSFIWNNAIWNDSANVRKQDAFSGSKMTIALAYSYDNGTEYYVDGTSICAASGLKAQNHGPAGVCIGGVGADGSGAFYAMKEMKVTAIAFFDSKISDDDIAAYRFPSEYIKYTKISADTSVSGINAQLATSTFESNKVSVANGVRITVDEAFETTIPLWIKSDGSINLYADTQPATSYFTGVDFSGVKGGVLRSWLTPGVVGYNFKSNSGSDTSLALVSGGTWLPASTADQASGSTTEMFADGLSTFKWSSANTWSWSSGTIMNGYLDDGGDHANIALSNVPYETYDVIVYAATDTEDASFNAVTVNGTQYTWDENSGEAVAGSTKWGISHQPLAAYGKNALRIKNLSGPLKITGGSNSNGARGCIAAVQIMPTTAADVEVKDYTLTLDGTAKNWSSGTWTSGGIAVSAPTLARNVEIVATASTALTIDSAVKVSQLTISGTGASVVTISNGSGGSLSVGEVVVASGILKPNGTPSTSMKLRVQDGGAIDLASAASSGYYTKIAGQGVLNDGKYTGALFSSANISGGAAQLRGITLSANATIRCDYNWGIIRSNYDSGTLSLGGYTLTKVGSENFWICNVTDSASGNIVVSEGRFATIKYKSTFSNATLTIGDGATLRMDTSDGGGATDLEVKNLVCDAGSTVNIAAAKTLTVTTALTANGTMKPLGTVTCNGNMTIGGDVVVPSDKTWTVAGTLTVANGGKLEIKNNALVPGALALADGGTLKIAKVSDAAHKVTAGTVTFPASGAAIIDVSDIPDLAENDEVDVLTGNTSLPSDVSTLKIVGKQYSLESESNTLKVVNDGGLVWNDGWTTGKDPTKYGDAIIASSGTVALGGTSLSFDSVTLSGSGTVSFSATGSETVSIKSLEIGAGVTLTANAALDLTDCTITGDGTLDIPVGTTYAMDGVTSSAKVTVEGTLETSGTTTLSGANTSAAGSLIEVVSDTTTLSSAFQGIGGNITIDAGAALTLGASLNGSKEDLLYNHINPNGSTILDISGTLNVGVYMLEFGSNIQVLLRTNARVTANTNVTGDNTALGYGHWAWLDSGMGLHAYGNAELALFIRTPSGVSPVFNIEEGATLVISQPFVSQTSVRDGGGSITKAGAGALKFTQDTLTKPITINAGKVQLKKAFTSGLAISIAEGAELELGVGQGNSDVTGISFANVTGTGTIRYSSTSTGYYTLPNSAANMFATTLSVINDNTHALIVTFNNNSSAVTTNRNMHGSGSYRSDWGSGTSRGLLALQDKNTEWSGTFWTSHDHRIKEFIVASVEGASQKTLTLSGTQVAAGSTPLTVESNGSANLTGTWVGNTTVAGTFGGTGNITGDLTFDAGSTFKVWATDADGLEATGALTLPVSGKITVDVSDLTLGANDSYSILTVESGLSNTSAFADLDSETHMLSVSSGTLYVVPIAATVTSSSGVTKCSSVDAAIGTMVFVGDNDAYVTVLKGTTTYTEEQLAENNVVYDSSDSTYRIAAAQIDSTKYGTLAKAIAAAASSGDTVTLLRDCTVTELSLAGKSITLDEGEYTFTGSFTGNGTLALPDGTLLKSPSSDRWAEGWTGTVWIRNYTSLTGQSIQSGSPYGETSFEPNDYGNINSTVKFTGVKGYFRANNVENYTIQPALELEDDGETPGLLLYNGWGYNQNAQCYTVVRKLKGSGTLKADSTSPASSVLLQVQNWDDFTGTLTLPKKTVVFGSTLPVQAEVDGGGCIVVQSGASVEVPADKTWTVGSGVVVYGNLSLGAGASIVNTTAANTWIKCGSGTVTLNALSDLPATPASGWTGTVVLSANQTFSDFNFDNYGRVGSTVRLQGTNSGWLSYRSNSDPIATTVEIPDGASLTITGWSPSFANGFNVIKGAGTFATSTAAPDASGSSSHTAYFLLKDVSNFTGSLSASGAGIAISDTRIANTVAGGKIILTSSATIAAGKTWTATGGIVLADAAATLTNTDGALSPAPTTTVANSYVKLTGSTYSVDTYKTVTFAGSNFSVAVTTNGQAVAVANSACTVEACAISFTITPSSGYHVTAVTPSSGSVSGEGPYAYTVSDDTTITVTTALDSSVAIGEATFVYGVDYTNATVTVAVTETDASGVQYTLTIGGKNYTASAVGGTTVTFNDVEVPRGAAYGAVSYTINSDATTTTGGGDRSAAVENVVAAGWINERAASTTGTSSSAAGAGGSWTNAVTYTDGAATITDNRFEADSPSATSRVVMEFEVCFTATSDENVSGEAQSALKLGEVNSETTFMVLAPGGSWTAVSNDALTPDPTATNKVVMTFDYANNTYSVDVDGHSLTNSSGSSSFSLAAPRTCVQNIDFAGTGTLVSMKGDQLEGYMVKDNAGHWYATIQAAIKAYNSANGPYTVLHDGTAPSGWKIDNDTKALIKAAMGTFFFLF